MSRAGSGNRRRGNGKQVIEGRIWTTFVTQPGGGGAVGGHPVAGPSKAPDKCLDDVAAGLADMSVASKSKIKTEDKMTPNVNNDTFYFAKVTVANNNRAGLVEDLVAMGYNREDSVYAAARSSCVETAVEYLHKLCDWCQLSFPDHKMVDMIRCQHRFCDTCATRHFVDVLGVHNINLKNAGCPLYCLPDFPSKADYLEYLYKLGPMLNELLDKGIYKKFCKARKDFEDSVGEDDIKICIKCRMEVPCRKLDIVTRVECPNCGDFAYSVEIFTILKENKMVSPELASMVFELNKMNFKLEESVLAVKNCDDLDSAVAFLRCDCNICFEGFPAVEMVQMLACKHSCCRTCAKQYFTTNIKEKNVNQLVCPSCSCPNFEKDSDETINMYLNNMDILLKNLVDSETHDLFQVKLRDAFLMKQPDFRWCNKCGFGFIVYGGYVTVCSQCQHSTCFHCKQTWHRQHEGITCEQFAAWKRQNEPTYHADTLEQYLEKHGIECPQCRMKYVLSKGGCMHFKCVQCKNEFCVGCKNKFLTGPACKVSANCVRMGMHAHHPRNCLFYLRDKSLTQLKQLLQDRRVYFDTEKKAGASRNCTMMVQKEVGRNQMVDEACGEYAPLGQAGLCREHYVEYLVELIRVNKVDSVDLMDVNGLIRELERNNVAVQGQLRNESEDDYRRFLIKEVQTKIPL